MWSSKWRQPQNEDNLKNEYNLKNGDELKNKGDFKTEDDFKDENDLKKEDNLKNYDKKKMTSWGWAVPSSAQLRLATTSLELCTSLGCLLIQLWLDMEAWLNCSLETAYTVLGLNEIAE